MKKSKKITTILLASIITLNTSGMLAYADTNINLIELDNLRAKIEKDIEIKGVAESEDLAKLENMIEAFENKSNSEDMERSGGWIDLGSGYRMRIDKPESNGNTKYHVHVYKGNKEVASENADGTPSHGKTLDNIGSKKIKDKVESNSKWKDAKKKQSKLSEATRKVKYKYTKTQLRKTTYVLLAKALVIGIVGFALFTTTGAWGSFFILI